MFQSASTQFAPGMTEDDRLTMIGVLEGLERANAEHEDTIDANKLLGQMIVEVSSPVIARL